MSYQFYVPTRTLFGAGMLNELHNQVMPGKKEPTPLELVDVKKYSSGAVFIRYKTK